MDESALELYRKVQDNLAEMKGLDESQAILDSLISDNIERHSALYLLGCVFIQRTQFGIAKEFLYQTLATAPDEPIIRNAIYNALGSCYQELSQHEKAIEYFNKALELKPDEPSPYTNLAVCYVHLGRLKEAEKVARIACKVDKENDQIWHNLAQSLLGQGKYKEGFQLYESRLKLNDRVERFYTSERNEPYWDGTKCKTIVVHGEQGLGDEIQFASLLPDVMKDCNVIYDCNSRLINLMRNSFPDIPIYGTKQTPSEQLVWPANYNNIEAKISIASLGKFYRRKYSDFPRKPYLKADPEIIEKYCKRLSELGDKPKIGISWYGGAKRSSTLSRFNPLSNWKEILGLDCDFVSLQYNPEAGEKIARFNAQNGTNIIHWPDMLGDYDETAGLLMNLDLVISAPQSVVHLAGALGVPCWRLCAKQAMWIHGVHGHDAPWYGSVKNYWQEEGNNWKPVMEEVCSDFKDFTLKLQQNRKAA